MSSSTPTNTSKLDRILADNQRDKEMGYRDKALKMYPHVCGGCDPASRYWSGWTNSWVHLCKRLMTVMT